MNEWKKKSKWMIERVLKPKREWKKERWSLKRINKIQCKIKKKKDIA